MRDVKKSPEIKLDDVELSLNNDSEQDIHESIEIRDGVDDIDGLSMRSGSQIV